MSLVPVVPVSMDDDASASELFCLSCQEPGHACIASIPATESMDGIYTRLRVQKRSGPVWAVVYHCSTALLRPFATQYGEYCGGCGCAELAACPDGCWWSGAFRVVMLRENHTMVLRICTRCAVLLDVADEGSCEDDSVVSCPESTGGCGCLSQ